MHKKKLQIQANIRAESAAQRRRLGANSSTITMANINYCNIMLLYCSEDKGRCQRLADYLIDDGFSVLMMDISTKLCQNNKFDCLIMCLSEQSYDVQESIKNTINQSDGKVILVKLKYFNTIIDGWLHDYLIDKLCYYLYGSDNYFNLEYDKLMLEMVRIPCFLFLASVQEQPKI